MAKLSRRAGSTSAVPSYAGYRFPAEVISHAVWLYLRFPLSLRMVDELLAARGIVVSRETARQWAKLTEGSAGTASGTVNGGAEVRPGVHKPDPPQAARSWRQMAHGRGCAANARPAMACGAAWKMRVEDMTAYAGKPGLHTKN